MTALQDQRRLGRTGVAVSPLSLGAMMFGAWGNADHEDCIRIIHRALDAGINVVDTADLYSSGESESIVGEALARVDRSKVVLATKVGMPMGGEAHLRGGSRRYLIAACDASLKRLKTDWIDLYQLHRPDTDTDIDETLGTLSDLVQSGKIRYFGTSTFPAHQLVESLWTSERRGYKRIASEQPPYSLLTRGIEREVLPICEQYGIGVLTWSPLARGWLSGKFGTTYSAANPRAKRQPDHYDLSVAANQRKLEAVEQLTVLATEAGMSLPELALGFVLQRTDVTSVLIGPRTIEQLESLVGMSDVRLAGDVLDRIDEIVPPGSDVNPADPGWVPPAFANPRSRRRYAD